MHLTISHIREIQQYSENPALGFIIYALFIAYNIYGSFILQFHKYTRKTKIDPSAIIHPSACISPWGVVIDKNVKLLQISTGTSLITIFELFFSNNSEVIPGFNSPCLQINTSQRLLRKLSSHFNLSGSYAITMYIAHISYME